MLSSSASYKKGVDWFTVVLYFLLVGFGLTNLFAANYNPEVGLQFSFSSEYFKQFVWILVSLVCAGAIMLSDSKMFVEFSWLIYAFSIFLLIVVLFFGKEVYGAKAWLAVGPIAFQPCEFTKIGTALVLSRMMSRYEFSFKARDYIRLFGLLFLPVVIIILQNDTGSALVYFVLLFAMFREGMTPHVLLLGFSCIATAISAFLFGDGETMLGLCAIGFIAVQAMFINQEHRFVGLRDTIVGVVAGVGGWAVTTFILHKEIKFEYFILLGLAVSTVLLTITMIVKRMRRILWLLLYLWATIATAFATGFLFENVLGEHQKTRINVLFGIEDDPLGAGYNVNQSLIAIGSGGLTGKGFLAGTQTKLDFVPKQTTDFIFCTVGEEWGLLGSTTLILLYITLFLRIISLAEKQHSTFSRVYGYCVAAIFFFHFTINICMTIGLMPVIGIPLPFFSYGGSSLWGFSIMLWMFLKLDTDRNFLIR